MDGGREGVCFFMQQSRYTYNILQLLLHITIIVRVQHTHTYARMVFVLCNAVQGRKWAQYNIIPITWFEIIESRRYLRRVCVYVYRTYLLLP